MITLRSFAVFALVALQGASASAQMGPGMWALQLVIDGEGQPSQALPAVSECISQADIDDPTRTLPRPGGKCTLSNVERSPERATYDLACINGSLQSQGRAEIRYQPDRYDGAVKLAVTEGGAPAQLLTIRMIARRTGACTK